MRAVLIALTEELCRLKSAGVRTVAVSETSIEDLRAVVRRRARPKETGDRRLESGVIVQPTVLSAPADSFRTPHSALHNSGDGGDAAPVPIRPPISHLPSPAVAPFAATLPPPPVVELPAGDKAARWAVLRERVLNHPVCRAQVRRDKKVVFGVGSLDSQIMFVGEAPGADEEVQGEPFVGPAGQLLTKMIQGMGLMREQVYIGNIMNWRPQTPTAAGAQAPLARCRCPTDAHPARRRPTSRPASSTPRCCPALAGASWAT